MTKKIEKLTDEQFQELEKLHKAEDRTGFYIKYYEFTGCDQALEQAKISSFSGFLGGIAYTSNELLEKYDIKYPKEGVIDFSHKIETKIFTAIQHSFKDSNGDKTGILTDEQMVRIAQKAWAESTIGKGAFPGNMEVLLEQLWANPTNWKNAGDNTFNRGTGAGLAATFLQAVSLNTYAGQQSGKFYEDNPVQYRSYLTPDHAVKYFKDKNTDHTVYVEETGLRSKNNLIADTTYTKQEISEKLGIPIERIQKQSSKTITAGDNGDIFAVKTYKILPEASYFNFGTEALYNSFQTLRSMLGGKAIDADEFDYSAPIKTTGGSYNLLTKLYLAILFNIFFAEV